VAPAEHQALRSDLADAYSEGPDFKPPKDAMRFHLTYAGFLVAGKSDEAGTRAQHVHAIRKVFHGQLRNMWQQHPSLKSWTETDPNDKNNQKPITEIRANQYSRNGFRFVPMAVESQWTLVALDIIFLRSGIPGTLLRSADLDARLKTLIDALKMPKKLDELGGYSPAEDENPFFCLMEDDKLVSSMRISTDTLLQPTTADGRIHKNNARVVIAVHLSSYVQQFWNPFA
jgi:hypothetical protein